MTGDRPKGERFGLEAELRSVVTAKSRNLSGHPTPQELVAYHLDELAPEEADAIQEHLTYCRDCADVMLNLVAFTDTPPGQGALPASSLEREWQRLQARLKVEPNRPARHLVLNRALVLALAASVLVILGGLVWNLRLRERVADLSRPRADFVMASLVPEQRGAERSVETVTRVQVSRGHSGVALLLNLGDLRDFPSYRIEVVDADGGLMWQEAGVPRNQDGTFLLEIPLHLLKSQVYGVRLYGVRGDVRVAVAQYSFEVVRER